MKLFLASAFSVTGDKLLDLLDKPPQSTKIAFIPTASNCYEGEKPWLDADRKKLVQLGFELTNIDLAVETDSTLYAKLADIDVIFVAGGNATFLLQKARESGFFTMLPQLLDGNKIYIGSSAGSMIVGPSLEPFKDEELKELPPTFRVDSTDAIAVVDFIVLPHCNDKEFTAENQHIIDTYSKKYNLRALNDNQALVVVDKDIKTITL